jgi:hypothetical protein
MRIGLAILLALVLLSGCGRLLHSGGQPIPGPTPSLTPSPTGTAVPGEAGGGGDLEGGPADEAVTDGPDVTG